VTTPADTRPGSPDGPLWDPEAIPAATVVVVRDADAGVEVLMLRRDRDLSFAGGMWVFPGGRIDAADLDEVDPDLIAADDPQPDVTRLEHAARIAAVREAAEEAGLELDADSLVRWSHWTPPPMSPKRFTTAFFVAPLADGSGEVVIDDGEIREHRWLRPAAVIEGRDAGHIGLSPPTFITLSQLLPHDTVADLLDAAAVRRMEHFATRIEVIDADVIAMYHGDSGYESGDAAEPGARHRLWMGSTWRYERDV
jgi:8-oxo-dGTP pyrophosphatase MutT (NUDIX family)